jgi:uncharacterized protein (DUF2062 family)
MRRRRRDFWSRVARAVKFRLVVPLMRSRHTPEYSAWGTAIGLAWAFTPTVGIQMPLVLITWLLARRVFHWDFSLILGLAWTWATNVFTALPCYYLFYVTGRALLGRWDEVSGYEQFLALWHGFFRDDQTIEQQVAAMFDVLVRDWGLAMWVGCMPWSALVAFLGYRWSLKFIHAYRHAREHRRVERHRRRHGH